MNRLLTLAELAVGAGARRRVFEPLLADWQRELQHAAGPVARLAAIASGAFAFIRALAVCALIDGIWFPPMRASIVSLIAVTAAIGISVGVLLIAPTPRNVARDLSEPMAQWWVLVWATTLVPPAFLLGTFLLRRDTRATGRHAVVFTLLAAATATAIVVNTTDDALRRRYDTFDVQERMRELALERHRAGDPRYYGRWYEESLRTTVAERRAKFDRYRAYMEAIRYDPPPTWMERVTHWRPVMLAVIFAIIGWTLAGLGDISVPRAFGWWALVFGATIVLTPIFWLVVRVPMPRVAGWLMPAVFTSVACALAIHSVRSRNPMRPL